MTHSIYKILPDDQGLLMKLVNVATKVNLGQQLRLLKDGGVNILQPCALCRMQTRDLNAYLPVKKETKPLKII